MDPLTQQLVEGMVRSLHESLTGAKARGYDPCYALATHQRTQGPHEGAACETCQGLLTRDVAYHAQQRLSAQGETAE